jgi:hypothetical protein
MADGYRIVAFVVASALIACSDGAPPPLEDLGLRETLEASPGVVASLPPSSALQIRDRVRSARTEAARDLVVSSTSDPASPVADVRSIDRARADVGEDAFVGYALVGENDAFRATALAPPATGGEDGAPIELLGEHDPRTAAGDDIGFEAAHASGDVRASARRE